MLKFTHLRALVVALAFGATTACNSLLSVDNPARVPDTALDDPLLAPALEAGSIGTFQCGIINYAGTAGMLSGEYWASNAFVNNHPWEWRGIVQIKGEPGSCAYNRNSTFMGFYAPLQQARYQLEDTYKRVEKFTDAQVPTRAKILTEMRAYAGYAYLLLAEGMCSMAIDGGPLMTSAQVLAIAKDRFSDAITKATALGDQSLLNMALVGKARAELDLGTALVNPSAADLAAAAVDANKVPANFVRNAEFSSATQGRENRIWQLTINGGFLSIAPPYQGLTVTNSAGATISDPRVPVLNTGKVAPQDNVTPLWYQQKFLTATTPFPIATWEEAQLIYAEATGGQLGLDAINRVRAKNNIAPLVLADPNDAAAFETALLEERRRQLFSQGQRYSDMLRKGLPFQMGVNGVNRKGQVYSNLTCVPLPDVETQNNPNLQP
jgi:starch-binding outer membrane protein, SusD/RagB family